MLAKFLVTWKVKPNISETLSAQQASKWQSQELAVQLHISAPGAPTYRALELLRGVPGTRQIILSKVPIILWEKERKGEAREKEKGREEKGETKTEPQIFRYPVI